MQKKEKKRIVYLMTIVVRVGTGELSHWLLQQCQNVTKTGRPPLH